MKIIYPNGVATFNLDSDDVRITKAFFKFVKLLIKMKVDYHFA